MIAMKIMKSIIAQKKIDFADLVKDAKSVASFFLLLTNFESDRMTSRKHGLADETKCFKMAASQVASNNTNFFRIAGTLEAQTLGSVINVCLL